MYVSRFYVENQLCKKVNVFYMIVISEKFELKMYVIYLCRMDFVFTLLLPLDTGIAGRS